MSELIFHGVGKRKTAVARVWLKPGSGDIIVNKKPFETYFPAVTVREDILRPLNITDTKAKFDVVANIYGGGFSAQAQAMAHGITKALVAFNGDLRVGLKKEGLTTRDPRMKERKKYGRKAARKRFQFTKR
ncbi:MAG: 30S ribosomal protein S9 [Deltaproteobacteria bacterium]|nr:30S ribosomal protein S9 [Deltaproteobacteria bacterium]MCL5791652.1 30S ribosomal protein S9 [Deltaproteobacteria bacterium]